MKIQDLMAAPLKQLPRGLAGRRPRVLDLFCGAGGAGMGYWRAGFDVVGVDIVARPSYPFEFRQMDALDAILEFASEFLLVHTSPPCQYSSNLTKGTNKGRVYPNLIPAVRKACAWNGTSFVIENVVGAEVRRDVTLCGEMFSLGVLRHRYFEIGWLGSQLPEQPAHVKHRGPVRGWRHGVYRDGPYIAAYGKGGGKGSVREMQAAMGIAWTDDHKELTEAIPPAYTEWIGRQFIGEAGQWAERFEPDAGVRLATLARS